MIINSLQKNKIQNFGSKTLYKVNLLKDNKLIPAKITLLERNNQEDRNALKTIYSKWGKTDCKDRILTDFFLENNKDKFIAIELIDSEKPLAQRIKGLANINKSFDLFIKNIQTQPKTAYSCSLRDIKGTGEVLLSGIVKLAKELKLNGVKLHSENNAFFDYQKFPSIYDHPDGTTTRYLETPMFSKFIEKIHTKYS